MNFERMKIEVARPDDRMAPSGAAILRSLQNESLPIIDLVVRESFQNSLDAGLKEKDNVHIDVTTNKINTENIASYFEGISKELVNSLPQETTVLAIADSNTTGLTGEFKTDDSKVLDRSNIYKLIYGINMNQEAGDAGGSWGLGKTSFFRIGAGIVIYYSRIKRKDGIMEDRLAACLIEDAKKESPIMPGNPRGIAWWGEKKEDDNKYSKSYPITDQNFISKFLKDLDVKPYEENMTGTTIIVPFIKEEELTKKKNEDVLNHQVHWWESSMEESLEIAVKRWYSPRLMNKKYQVVFNQPYLSCTVNGSFINVAPQNKVFTIFRDLYDAALTNSSNNKDITIKNIYLKSLGMEDTSVPTGRIAFIKTTIDKIGMKKNRDLLPLAYIGESKEFSKNSNKILAYSRKPGMIVEYVVDDNDWMKGTHVEEDEYVFSFFVPNSEGKLHDRYQPKFKTLENYLRETENADHADWNDIHIGKYAVTIIKRIKLEVSKAMAAVLGETLETISSRRTSSLSRKYGQLFLPKTNFGKAGSRREKPKVDSGENQKRIRHGSIQIDNFKVNIDNTINITAKVSLPKKSEYNFLVNVVAIDGVLNVSKWYKTFNNKIPYPFEIIDIKIDQSYAEFEIVENNENKMQAYKFRNNTEVTIESTIYFTMRVHDATMSAISLSKNKDII